MGFHTVNVSTTICNDLLACKQGSSEKIPILEFVQLVLIPREIPYKFKLAKLVNVQYNNAAIQDIDEIDFLMKL